MMPRNRLWLEILKDNIVHGSTKLGLKLPKKILVAVELGLRVADDSLKVLEPQSQASSEPSFGLARAFVVSLRNLSIVKVKKCSDFISYYNV